MKCLMTLLLALTTNFAHAHFTTEVTSHGSVEAELLLRSEAPVMIALKDALVKSPMIKEVINDYVKPGTVFEGHGVRFVFNDANNSYSAFSLNGKISDLTKITSVGGGIYLSGKGVANALYTALQTSRSSAVQRQGSINPSGHGHGQRVFVIGESEDGNIMISCTPYFDNNEVKLCEIRKI